MIRIATFLAGLAVSALAMPAVAGHHARAEIMQLAWCGGGAASQAGLSLLHCPACPALVAGFALMMASPFVRPVRRFASVRRGAA